MNPEAILRFMLRAGACMLCLAFVAVLLPTGFMASSHEALGLGPFPDGPLTQYLTRTISALYGFHGILLWIVSGDVRRYRPIIRFLGVMNVVFGVITLAVDTLAPLPLLWTLAEGPPLIAMGLVVLYLVGKVPDARLAAHDGRGAST